MTAIKSLCVAVFTLAAITRWAEARAEVKDEPFASQSLSQPDKNEYRAAAPLSDKHKFGYELGENKHFHHTTTDEDGVRLGCYGHILEGKKYSTQYVADANGYRTVPTHDLITVYPKSGGERKASFIRSFSEDELMSQNIRFFFPDGCKARDDPERLEVASSVLAPVVVHPRRPHKRRSSIANPLIPLKERKPSPIHSPKHPSPR